MSNSDFLSGVHRLLQFVWAILSSLGLFLVEEKQLLLPPLLPTWFKALPHTHDREERERGRWMDRVNRERDKVIDRGRE